MKGGDLLPKSIEKFSDPYLALEYRNRQRYNNYYGNGQDKRARARRKWLPVEDRYVLMHKMPDRELAKILKRTVPAIQQRRNELKKNPGNLD